MVSACFLQHCQIAGKSRVASSTALGSKGSIGTPVKAGGMVITCWLGLSAAKPARVRTSKAGGTLPESPCPGCSSTTRRQWAPVMGA